MSVFAQRKRTTLLKYETSIAKTLHYDVACRTMIPHHKNYVFNHRFIGAIGLQPVETNYNLLRQTDYNLLRQKRRKNQQNRCQKSYQIYVQRSIKLI